MKFKLFQLFPKRLHADPKDAVLSRSEQKMLYEIITLCRTENASDMETLMKQYVPEIESEAQAFEIEQQVQGTLTRIVIQLWCTVPERAVLVRLVSRLGLEKSVRSVLWKGIPAAVLF